MQDFVVELYKRIIDICDYYVVANKASIISDIKGLIPDIQRFVTWFIETEDIGVEAQIKTSMNNQVLEMLRDMSIALERGDSVLMFDATKEGVAEYLKLFIPEEELV
ncbi:MAG: hypothetical protein E7241_10150 [Lachnospiraceae bacterium]|jgi:hypothetical protein|nr:hypothetical protein [Lachnospiraceae bacterium]